MVADWLAPRQATFGGEGPVALPLEPSRVGGCEEPGRHAESRRQGVRATPFVARARACGGGRRDGERAGQRREKKEQRMSHRHEKTQHSRLAAHVTVCNQHLQHTEYALPHVLVHRFSFAARMPTGQQHSMQILVPHLEIEPALMCRLAVMHTIKCGCCHSSPCQDTGTNSKWFVVPK